ncbi:MAG: SMP-30/gluconolactonase/LRE family protein, partial [Bryobacteraceae bacterium]|nr:SMP-30/gluconolactonase/LRE family protein [Bryobacteraceae bacterium]
MRTILIGLLALQPVWGQPAPYLISTVAGGTRSAFPAQGTTAQQLRLILPEFVTSDAAGNLYVSDTYYDRVLRIAPSGAVTTYAGSETGFGGDGGSPTAARLNGVAGMVVSPSGELYLCDRRNARVRKIAAGGATITTIAGNGSLAATAGGAGNPRGIALDAAGNVYFSDSFNHIVRRIDSTGNVTTIAGIAGRQGFSGDGAAATSATLQSPGGVAVDAQGNLYIADTQNNRVRRVNPQGRIDTVAGTGVAGETGDSGPPTSAQLNNPTDVAVNRDGDLFIASRNGGRIRRVRGTTISTVAGGGTGRQFPSSARQFSLALPNSIAITPTGDLLVLDDGRRRLYRVNLTSDSIQLAAGALAEEAPGDNGPATQATLYQPTGVAVDPDGNVYISDVIENRIRRVSPSGVITTFAGNGILGQTTGEGRSAELGRPRGLAMDSNRNLYVAVTWGAYVRRITPTGQITTFAGISGPGGFAGDSGPAASARLNIPIGVTVDREGNVYIADSGNNRIRRVTPAGVINTIAGTGVRGFAGDGGPAVAAQLAGPQGVAVDTLGNLYVADTANHRIRRIDRSGTISTVAGTGEPGTEGAGGPALQAQLWLPGGIVFDSAGNLLIPMLGAGQIRALTPEGTVAVVAGARTTGFSGDGGLAEEARLASPSSVAIGPDGS